MRPAPSARRWLRSAFGLPSAAAIVALVRRSPVDVGLALLYHRIGDPAGSPSSELVPRMSTRRFDRHMAWVARHFDVVAASDLPERVRTRRPGRRIPVAVTFDDDVPEHLRFAAPILAAHGVRATFFLCGHALERPQAFWWERLQAARDRGVLQHALEATSLHPLARDAAAQPPAIHALGAALQHLPAAERDAISERLLAALGGDPPDAGMRAGDVGRLSAHGHEVGFHTRRHDGLTLLGGDALDAALADGAQALARAAGAPPTALAYPHGMADRRVADRARAAGWTTGWTTVGRAVRGDDDPLLLPRLEPSASDVGDLAAGVALALARAAMASLRQRDGDGR